MITLYDTLNLIALDAELEVYDFQHNLIQAGRNGPTDWDGDLLDKRVYKIVPSVITRIFLDE